jgi:DNA-directed RNA polymerase specialized sigma24 family protein
MEYSNSQVRRIIEDFIHSERDRELLARRLIDGITIERLAEEFELSSRQVKNILRKGEEIIFRKIP